MTAQPASSAASVKPRLPDADDRDRIETELDRTLLVEASAGTGKTTALIRRMVALLREGRCQIDTLAAVTFTRKAAAEIRSRLQVGLEAAARDADGEPRRRLEEARRRSESCFVGTIHSFCGRLLRERPVEAGVDPGFGELEDDDDARLRSAAWREHLSALLAAEVPDAAAPGSRPMLSRLDDVGLSPMALGPAFQSFAYHADVAEWPAPDVPLPDLTSITAELAKYAKHVRSLDLPTSAGNDKLMPLCQRVAGRADRLDPARPAQVMSVLELMQPLEPGALVQRNWPGGKAQALEELDRWNELAGRATELVQIWREHRYAIVMQALRPARTCYDRLRAEANGLNFQDLLLGAAALLRDRPEVRRYFRRRFTHLLVDEFQDTDPVQAEVMLLLTADDHEERVWTRCRPVPGSLFVVGDPKQSIYRFRRADIVTYDRVRTIIESSGGRVVPLRANFRSDPPVIGWVNNCFSRLFPEKSDLYRPADAPLLVGRPAIEDTEPNVCVFRLTIPDSVSKRGDVAEYEADRIARTIRNWLDERRPISRSDGDRAAGLPDHAVPSDFLIVTRTKKHLADYGAALGRYGIPHEITGGGGLCAIPELRLLRDCLRAVARPDDPLAFVGVLRSELFGFADTTLYEFRRRGGRFSYRLPAIPKDLGEEGIRLKDACRRLRRYAGWLRRFPAAAAVERIVADLGLAARACAEEDGTARAGGLLKSIELLRGREFGSAVEVVDAFSEWVDGAAAMDGATVLPPRERPVRIMNLHQCKGLEAPVVFLAEPSGFAQHPPLLHVDRSSGKATGYLAICGDSQFEFAKRPLLAHPPGWADHQAEEAQFLAAEEQRLLYVAATRAGRQLVVSLRAKSPDKNPWSAFAPYLDSVPELADPGIITAVVPIEDDRVDSPDDASWNTELAAVTGRVQHATQPTYAVGAVKALSVRGVGKPRGYGEDGTKWGTLLHTLLEAANASTTQLAELARDQAQQLELDEALADEAVSTVTAVMQSPLWTRAQAAETRLVEVPFALPRAAETSLDGLPMVLKGVVDLAFREADGWVIVDYKSDRVEATDLQSLITHYEPQVMAYREAWAEITGDHVKEQGLFFTHTGRYAHVSGSKSTQEGSRARFPST